MNWLSLVSFIATRVPQAVLGVEAIVTGAKQGATKKQLAMASLGLASDVATSCVPTDLQPAVTAATSLASSAIDNFVYLMNVAKGKTSVTVLPSEPVAPATETKSAPAQAFQNPDWSSGATQS